MHLDILPRLTPNLRSTGIRKIGKGPLPAVYLKKWIDEAGYVNVVERRISVPVNPWARGAE